MLATILVENFPTDSEPRLHSHGPQVCDADKEQTICVQSKIVINLSFELFLSL